MRYKYIENHVPTATMEPNLQTTLKSDSHVCRLLYSTASARGTSMLLPDNLLSRSWGPASLGSWLAVWRSPTSHIFNFDYLRLWGGRYAPDVASGQWWRWVSSLLLHQSSIHLAGNAALMLVRVAGRRQGGREGDGGKGRGVQTEMSRDWKHTRGSEA